VSYLNLILRPREFTSALAGQLCHWFDQRRARNVGHLHFATSDG
jgi:uncharacterized protein YjiS (DUF1127 family)